MIISCYPMLGVLWYTYLTHTLGSSEDLEFKTTPSHSKTLSHKTKTAPKLACLFKISNL